MAAVDDFVSQFTTLVNSFETVKVGELLANACKQGTTEVLQNLTNTDLLARLADSITEQQTADTQHNLVPEALKPYFVKRYDAMLGCCGKFLEIICGTCGCTYGNPHSSNCPVAKIEELLSA